MDCPLENPATMGTTLSLPPSQLPDAPEPAEGQPQREALRAPALCWPGPEELGEPFAD